MSPSAGFTPSDPVNMMRLAVEASGLGVWEMDVLQGQIFWSDRCNQLFFLPPGTQPSYPDFLNCLHPDDWQRTDKLVRQAFDPAGSGRYDTEYRVLDPAAPDGPGRWIRASGQAFTNAQGLPYRFIGTVRDVTEHKATESEYRFLADAMPQIVWTARPDGGLDYYNQRWFDYTGLTLEQTQGWGWEPVLHPDDLANCVAVWEHAVRTGEPYQVEYRFRRAADGAYRWHLGRALPQRDAAGHIIKWYGTCTDIDEQKRAVDELRVSESRLEQALADLEAKITFRTLDLEREVQQLRSDNERLARPAG